MRERLRRGAWTLLRAGAALAAGAVARRVARGAWRRAAASDPPPERMAADGESSPRLRSVVAWSVAAGTAVAVARVLGRRGAAKAWKKTTGSPPPEGQEVRA